jgi:hypothetical protein
VLDVDADDLTLFIQIDRGALLRFARIHTWTCVQVDVERVSLAVAGDAEINCPRNGERAAGTGRCRTNIAPEVPCP